ALAAFGVERRGDVGGAGGGERHDGGEGDQRSAQPDGHEGHCAGCLQSIAMNGFDVCVRGRGAVGLSLALDLGRRGLRVALVGEPARADAGPDVRTYALNAGSIELLSQLKVWDALRATPGAATRVIDMQVRGDAR